MKTIKEILEFSFPIAVCIAVIAIVTINYLNI